MSELPGRKALILQALVIEYVASAEPIGSEHLSQKYDFGVRAATIRNELADLGEQGFIEQPHTSAGRIPSDRGYRYFVDHFILDMDPEAATKQKVRKVSAEGEALQDLLRDTTRALAKLTKLLSVATMTRDTGIRVRQAILSAIGQERALLVLVLSNGHVENRVIACPQGLTLEQLGRANQELRLMAEGTTMRALNKVKAPEIHDAAPLDHLLKRAASSLRAVAREFMRGKLITAGEEYLLSQPEFRNDADRLLQLLASLGDEDAMSLALSASGEQPVTIGREHSNPDLHQLSVVRHAFFVGPDEAGTIAIIGPTRMGYNVNVPLVQFTAKALTDALSKLLPST